MRTHAVLASDFGGSTIVVSEKPNSMAIRRMSSSDRRRCSSSTTASWLPPNLCDEKTSTVSNLTEEEAAETKARRQTFMTQSFFVASLSWSWYSLRRTTGVRRVRMKIEVSGDALSCSISASSMSRAAVGSQVSHALEVSWS